MAAQCHAVGGQPVQQVRQPSRRLVHPLARQDKMSINARLPCEQHGFHQVGGILHRVVARRHADDQ